MKAIEKLAYMRAINDAREILIAAGNKLLSESKPKEAEAIGRASKEVAKLLNGI